MPTKNEPPGRLAWFRNAFFAGLLVLVPGIVSVGVVLWLFNTLTGQIPAAVKYLTPKGTHWFVEENGLLVRLLALALMVLLTTGIGLLAQNVLGRKLLQIGERVLLRLPIVRPVYSSVKQISDTVGSGQAHLFRQVVMIEYPKAGCYVLAFLTADACEECQTAADADLISVFVPTTPNPTSGFLLMLPRRDVRMLRMSVPEAMRLIISAGVVRPPPPAPEKQPPTPEHSC